MHRLTVAALLVVGTAAFAADTPPPALALGGLDPIALADGKETPGLETIEATYGRFKYRFATAENKKAFEAKPEERAIQFGGACGRMGPFSGTGDPKRYAVHDRRIYIFASPGCRDGFLRDPEKHIDKPNPEPTGTAEQAKRGAELVATAVEGFGGAKVVDALTSLHRAERLTYKSGDQETVGAARTTWVYPDRVRVEQDFGTPYGHVVRADGGFEIAGKEVFPLEPAMRDDAWRRALRDPLVVLRNRGTKGFVAVAKGADKVGDTPVETVEVALNGATSTWSIDPKSGRILRIAYRGRRVGSVGDNVVTFADFKAVDGLVLPHARTEFFNGKELTSPERRTDEIAVNGKMKDELFKQPK